MSFRTVGLVYRRFGLSVYYYCTLPTNSSQVRVSSPETEFLGDFLCHNPYSSQVRVSFPETGFLGDFPCHILGSGFFFCYGKLRDMDPPSHFELSLSTFSDQNHPKKNSRPFRRKLWREYFFWVKIFFFPLVRSDLRFQIVVLLRGLWGHQKSGPF